MFKKLQLLALALFLPLCASAQSGSLSGKVTDAKTGEPLTGATVIIQSITKGASADINGDYTVTGIPAGSYTVLTQFVGYKTATNTVEIGSGSVTLDIELAVDLVGLEELVITGYGSVNRANLTSSISKVSRKEIEESPVVSADALLQGKAAGVQVNADSGTPGGGVSVRIRGASSISANNDPLYVVDGIPLNTGSNSAIGVGNQQLNAISDLNPNEIESIEILKDASATAIYGSRGANGVVLITTRRGVAGDSKINVNISSGFKEFPNQLEFVNSAQFIEMYVDGLYADYIIGGDYANQPWGTYDDRHNAVAGFLAPFGGYAAVGLPEIDEFGANPSAAPTTDWQDAVFQTGVTQNYSINASGGDVKTRYYVSGDYYDEKGIMLNSGFERINGRLNLDHNINDKASISTSVSYLRSVSERLENDNNIYGVLTSAYLSYPTRAIYNDDGTFNNSVGAFSNPVSASEVFNEAVRTRFIGNVKGEYKFTDEFRITGSLGLDRYDLNEDTYSPSFTNQGSPLGSGAASVGITQTWISEVQAQYNSVFNDVHSVDAVAAISYQENEFERTFTSGTDYPGDVLPNVTNAATTTGSSTGTSSGLESYTARVNYGYDSRYLLTLSGRLDGSSRFSEDNQYGFFPSVAAAWRVSNESFMEDVDLIDELKLRASVGIVGNQGIGNFNYQALFGITSYSGTPGLAPSQLPNPDLKWEETTQVDVGVDIAMLDERVSIALDAYMKTTEDLLLNRPVPSITGFTSFSSNIGSTENQGIELTLTTTNVQTRDMQWTTSLNLSTNRNEVTKLFNDEPFSSGFASRIQVGEEIGAFYGYITDGIWNSQAEIDAYLAEDPANSVGNAVPGDVRFVDLNDDGVVNSLDQKIMGSANPDFFGGFNSNFSFQGFELNAFFQFQYGNEIYNNNRGFYEHFGFSYTATTKALDRWDPDNMDTNVYRSTWFDDNNNTGRDSDLFLEDGSYLRLKSLTVAYNFDEELLDRIGLRSARIYATGANLLTFTEYEGPDPEVNTFSGSNTSLGTDFFTYPQARSIQFGINFGL